MPIRGAWVALAAGVGLFACSRPPTSPPVQENLIADETAGASSDGGTAVAMTGDGEMSYPPGTASVLPPKPVDYSRPHDDAGFNDTYSLEPSACVDRAFIPEEARPKPCAIRSYDGEHLWSEELFDLQGRQTQFKTWLPDGGPRGLMTATYGPYGMLTHDDWEAHIHEEWTYTADGGFASRLHDDGRGNVSTTYALYSSEGVRIGTDTFGTDGGLTFHEDYKYDGGLLVQIHGADPDGCHAEDHAFSYFADGGMKREEFHSYPCRYGGLDWVRIWDDRGRLIHTWGSNDERDAEHEYTWDGGSMIADRWLMTWSRGVTRNTYDANGNMALSFTYDWELLSNRDIELTRRFTYACGTSDLLLEEQDMGNDGIVDGWRVIDRDDAGTPLKETFSGTFASDSTHSLVYQYSCPEP